ncbi:MAG: hypothetical protein KBS35_00465 [Mycoplasma sp.]|nr:hypothetical protein [Candidatus Hennigella equi]
MATKIKVLNLQNLKKSNLPLVVGYFGCIHVMHGQLLSKHHNYNVLTFKDFANKSPSQIYSYKNRLNNLVKFKPENIFIYDIAKSNMTAQQFIEKILLKIKPSSIVVGTDFKFGSDHKSWTLLKQYFDVETINYNPKVSTTIISKLLRDANIERANDLTYFPYYYTSKWVGGRHQGKVLGARTINLEISDNFILPEGSYISRITIGNKKYKAITFYGKSKTYKLSTPTLETHVIGKTIFPRSLYPSAIRNNIKVEFFKFLRSNTKYAKPEALFEAIKKDLNKAKDYFEHNK